MKKRTIDITSSILLEDIADEISMLDHESIIDFILMLDEKNRRYGYNNRFDYKIS